MKKIFILSLFFNISLCFSQDFKLIENYTSKISNINYKIGDSIVIGKPLTRGKNLRYENILVLNNQQFQNLNEDFSNNVGVIEKIYSNNYNSNYNFNNSIVFELKIKDKPNTFVPIDKAIISKEIVIYELNFSPDKFKSFNKSNSTILKINNSKLTEEQAMLFYYKENNQETYNELKGNEFYYQKNKEKYIKYVDSLKKTVKNTDTLVLILPTKLGKYNFEKKEFPIVEQSMSYGKKFETIFSNEILDFENYINFSSVKSEFENAEFFSNSTNLEFDDTRKANVILLVTFSKISFSEKSGLNIDGLEYNSKIHLQLNIKKLYCVDSNSFYYNFIGSK
jgi:hypothetical protein